MVYLFYTTYISVDIAHHEISHAKVGKGGIINIKDARRVPILTGGQTWYNYFIPHTSV